MDVNEISEAAQANRENGDELATSRALDLVARVREALIAQGYNVEQVEPVEEDV